MIDNNKRFNIQNAEGRYEECFGEACADVLGNYFENLIDPDFSMTAGFHVQGKGGSDNGMDLMAGMYGACFFGALLEMNDVSDPIQTSEARETDWNSYTPTQIADAAKLAPFIKGVKPLYGFDQVSEYTKTAQMGCILEMKWYSSWNGVDGQLPMPKVNEAFSYHFVAAYETLALGIQIKAFDAPFYHYLPRPLFEKAVVAAAGFDVNTYRFLTLVNGIFYTRNWSLLPYLASGTMKRV